MTFKLIYMIYYLQVILNTESEFQTNLARSFNNLHNHAISKDICLCITEKSFLGLLHNFTTTSFTKFKHSLFFRLHGLRFHNNTKNLI